MRRVLKRLFTPPLVVVAALLVLLEETLIVWLQQLMARLASLRWIAALEACAARLPPYPAMILFLLPVIQVLVVELVGAWLLLLGQPLLGAAIAGVGKAIGTALAGRVYKVVRPALATLPWFVWIETRVFAWRDRLYGAVRGMPAWQAAVAVVHRCRTWMRAHLDRFRNMRPGWILRRLAAIRRRARWSA